MSNSATSKTSLKNLFSSGNLIAIVLIIVVLFFVLVILWIIFSLRNKQLTQKQFLASPIKLNDLTTPFNIPSKDLPKPTVGREYTYSFWLYVDKLEPKTLPGKTSSNTNVNVSKDSLVFFRGSDGDIKSANPLVFMDGQTNKLYIAIKTENSILGTSLEAPYTDKNDKENYLNIYNANQNLASVRLNNYFLNKTLSNDSNKHIILTIDYIPLQRWVNVTFIVDNKVCTVFMDGEIYSVKSTEEYKSMRPTERNTKGVMLDINLIVDKTDGDIFVGKNAKISSGETPEGYFSRLRFFNYAASLNEVRQVYNEGPVSGSLFGIPGLSYGVRSPIYKLGT